MRVALLIAVLLVGTPGVSFAQVVQTKTLISSGGVHSSSGTLTMSSNVGDAIAGYSKEAPHVVWHGFYAPGLTQVVGVDNWPKITFFSYLGRISPNPARGPLTIEFGNAVAQSVSLEIYDVAGRLVRSLHRSSLHAGVFRIPWDLRSNEDHPVGTGVYFVRLATRGFQETGRMVVVR